MVLSPPVMRERFYSSTGTGLIFVFIFPTSIFYHYNHFSFAILRLRIYYQCSQCNLERNIDIYIHSTSCTRSLLSSYLFTYLIILLVKPLRPLFTTRLSHKPFTLRVFLYVGKHVTQRKIALKRILSYSDTRGSIRFILRSWVLHTGAIDLIGCFLL